MNEPQTDLTGETFRAALREWGVSPLEALSLLREPDSDALSTPAPHQAAVLSARVTGADVTLDLTGHTAVTCTDLRPEDVSGPDVVFVDVTDRPRVITAAEMVAAHLPGAAGDDRLNLLALHAALRGPAPQVDEALEAAHRVLTGQCTPEAVAALTLFTLQAAGLARCEALTEGPVAAS